MKRSKKILQWIVIILTGLLFMLCAVYTIWVLVRDNKTLAPEAKLISVFVALLFVMLSVFLWTTGIKAFDLRFRIFRSAVLILALLGIFAFKLRMVGRVIDYLDFPKMHTFLYSGSYALTQAALLLLIVYYAFILKRRPLFPKASVLLPVIAMVLFLGSFILEIILFFAYGIGLEANALRTILTRPVFYLGFVGLCVYFLFPPPTVLPPPQ